MGLSDVAAFKAVLSHKAASYAAGTHLSSAIDTAGYHQALIIFNCGTTTGSGTSDLTVTFSDASGGTYSAFAGAVVPQVTSANDDAVYVGRINLDGTERYMKTSLINATAASLQSITVILTPYYTGDGTAFTFEV